MKSSPISDGSSKCLADQAGRKMEYLRLSVGDRCNLRCLYCLPEKPNFAAKSTQQPLDMLGYLSELLVEMGIKKIRVTGGEPLLRKNIRFLLQYLHGLRAKGLQEITLTTNASYLAKYAAILPDYGIERVNISLDSLCPQNFAKITRGGTLDQVLAGIQAADQAGLKIKINMVVLRHINHLEVLDMLRWCGVHGFDLTLIELMPMGDMPVSWRQEHFIPLSEITAQLQQNLQLQATDSSPFAGPARRFFVPETGNILGLITPLSENFCAGCNRLRLTAQGVLYPCLGNQGAVDLARIYQHDRDLARQAVQEAWYAKAPRHEFAIDRQGVRGTMPAFMSMMGG